MSTSDEASPAQRPLWRSVAIPTEHGGWGLTLEPVLLGLLLAFSWPGVAIGLAAFVAFLVRTPLKLAVVDRRRQRLLPRTRLATRIAIVELGLITVFGAFALWGAGVEWLAPVLIAAPLIAVELWFDIRSRSRRLVPELAGAVGISAVAAAIVLAGSDDARLTAASWMILGARAIASIPYVRTQIVRTRRGATSLGHADRFLIAGALVGVGAAIVSGRVLAGAVAVGLASCFQAMALRREHIPPVKVIGLRQMATGLAIVAATALGALA